MNIDLRFKLRNDSYFYQEIVGKHVYNNYKFYCKTGNYMQFPEPDTFNNIMNSVININNIEDFNVNHELQNFSNYISNNDDNSNDFVSENSIMEITNIWKRIIITTQENPQNQFDNWGRIIYYLEFKVITQQGNEFIFVCSLEGLLLSELLYSFNPIENNLEVNLANLIQKQNEFDNILKDIVHFKLELDDDTIEIFMPN